MNEDPDKPNAQAYRCRDLVPTYMNKNDPFLLFMFIRSCLFLAAL